MRIVLKDHQRYFPERWKNIGKEPPGNRTDQRGY